MKTSSSHVIYLRDTSQNGGHEPTLFKFMEAVHKCPAVWEVSSLGYNDTNKNKQNKTEERAEQLRFVQTFPFLHRFLFLLFFFSVSLLYMSATTLKNGHVAYYRVCDLTRVWRVKERICQLFEVFQHEFANLSLRCEGRLRRSLFPAKSLNVWLNCPENVSLEHLPFLYKDFSFIAFLVSTDPWWQPD